MFTLTKEALQKIERNKALKGMVRKKEIEIRVISSLDKNTLETSAMLLDLKGLFQKQLPKMPKEYVVRLVFDIKHKSMVITDQSKKVLGGICFRTFYDDSFVEIVFCAVSSDSQIKGYGEFMMNMFKKTVKEEFSKETKARGGARAPSDPIYLLTYADNYAIGYFKKQGFTKEITFTQWQGRIKDYEGGTLMQGKILTTIDYTNIYTMLLKRREALIRLLKKKQPEMFKEYRLPDHEAAVAPMDIPGLKEAGFTEEMSSTLEPRGSLKELLLYLCTELKNHNTAWPFLDPVNPEDVADYHAVIKTPMDLRTVESKILSEDYATFEEMDADIQLVISNCYIYNAPGSQYAKCAKSLNEFYQNKVKWCRSALSRRE
ncbi:histone acetyltransferase [Nematocida displodere]|uniref:histone acetyltransferase n=1 Tax=Nematocida displodere TaxID=1805483 RepID=A0A177EID6_9MICR|nr:histone acetyltransferase [Nematocida displodere]